MMKLVIDRQTWLRGENDSYLLRAKDNKMCCLGFLSLACGYTKEEIRDKITPFTMLSKDKYPEQIQEDSKVGLKGSFSTFTSGLMRINDDSCKTEIIRETKLKELFAQMDIDVEFIN